MIVELARDLARRYMRCSGVPHAGPPQYLSYLGIARYAAQEPMRMMLTRSSGLYAARAAPLIHEIFSGLVGGAVQTGWARCRTISSTTEVCRP